MSANTIVLATRNRGKIRELTSIFAVLPLTVRTLDEFPHVADVDETGTTFHANAELKAIAVARETGEISLADDSGLEVEALDGAPGVYSARFAGETSGYDVKIPRLLEAIRKADDLNRRARFVCVMVLATPDGEVLTSVEGVCEGTIVNDSRGDGGFGYDPIFVPDGYDQTFGELAPDIKSEISHRGRAAKLMMRYLLDFIVV